MARRIDITILKTDISFFKGIFAYGIVFYIQTGNSLLDVLCRQIGIEKSYLDQRVQTIFLNNKVVDDLVAETVADGAVIALSAAMPGLFGAVVRRDGLLAPMRTAYTPSNPVEAKHDGHVTLKLFNLIASELGPRLLEKGVYMKNKDFVDYVNWKRSVLQSVCRSVSIDGNQGDMDEIFNLNGQGGDIFLRLNFC